MRVASGVLLMSLFIGNLAWAASPPEVRCGVRKLGAAARACRALLLAEARFFSNGDAARREALSATALARFIEAWNGAERLDPSGTCAALSAPWDGAASRLPRAVTAAVEALPGNNACRAKLLRALAGQCARAVRSEQPFVRGSQRALAARARAVAGIRARLQSAFPAECVATTSAQEAAEAVFRTAGIAIGDATTRGLRPLGQEAGIAIGAAIEPHEVASDPAYAAVLAREIGSLTAENAMKWGPIHPQQNVYDFAAADAVVALADAAARRLRGHTLVWGQMQLPPYVENATSAEELRGYLTGHIATVAGRWAGRTAQWDVVNEPLPALGEPAGPDGLDDNVFLRLLGSGYIAEALTLARTADPGAKLFLNENGIEAPGPRQDRFFALVQELLTVGAPLDGVGFQAHIGLIPWGQYPDGATIEASLRRFADLGLDVELTELDVSLFFRGGDVPSRIEFQGDYVREVIEACTRVPRCTGVTFWGLSDRYSWIPAFLGLTDWPLPFDENWRPKPAYFGARAALATAALRKS